MVKDIYWLSHCGESNQKRERVEAEKKKEIENVYSWIQLLHIDRYMPGKNCPFFQSKFYKWIIVP